MSGFEVVLLLLGIGGIIVLKYTNNARYNELDKRDLKKLYDKK